MMLAPHGPLVLIYRFDETSLSHFNLRRRAVEDLLMEVMEIRLLLSA
jgi:hypothetical protein